MRKLTLEEMYEVYRYMEVELGEVNITTSIADFALLLLEGLKATPEFYLRIIVLFTGKEEQEIIEQDAITVVGWFLQGLQVNQILRFSQVCRELRADYGRF
jgi:hypothetical protein